MHPTSWAGSPAKAGAARESLPGCQCWKGAILAFLHSFSKCLECQLSAAGGGQQGVAALGGVSSGEDSNPGSTSQV